MGRGAHLFSPKNAARTGESDAGRELNQLSIVNRKLSILAARGGCLFALRGGAFGVSKGSLLFARFWGNFAETKANCFRN